MKPEILCQMIADLTSPDETLRQQAQKTLHREDEDIIPVLIDEFYAGVGAQTGAAVLEIIGQIGGYQATQLFFELVADSSTMPCWREVAERWLHQDEML